MIGRKRATAITNYQKDKLIIVCDVEKQRAESLAADFQCLSDTQWKNVVSRKDIDIVVNSSINEVSEPVTVSALNAGKHVLCEKPLGRNVQEALAMVEASRKSNRNPQNRIQSYFSSRNLEGKKTFRWRCDRKIT